MFRLVMLLVLLTALRANAAALFANIDEYVQSLALGEAKQQSVRATGSPQRVFGIAYGSKYEDRKAVVFVLAIRPDGSLAAISRSPAFDFQDLSARTDVEIVQAQSARRFSIQVNSRSVCGVYVKIFRFAETSGGWVLSGMDSSEPTCGKEGAVLEKASASTNFLTGDQAERDYDEGKLVKQRRIKQAPRVLPLTEYQMWSDAYGPSK